MQKIIFVLNFICALIRICSAVFAYTHNAWKKKKLTVKANIERIAQ